MRACFLVGVRIPLGRLSFRNLFDAGSRFGLLMLFANHRRREVVRSLELLLHGRNFLPFLIEEPGVGNMIGPFHVNAQDETVSACVLAGKSELELTASYFEIHANGGFGAEDPLHSYIICISCSDDHLVAFALFFRRIFL